MTKTQKKVTSPYHCTRSGEVTGMVQGRKTYLGRVWKDGREWRCDLNSGRYPTQTAAVFGLADSINGPLA